MVWKALDREEGIEVAWNVLQTSKSEFAEFSSEIDILKRVRHANIINFHESWFRDGEFIFITELMTSGTLREYLVTCLEQLTMENNLFCSFSFSSFFYRVHSLGT